MILTTHAIAGAAVGSLTPSHPVAGFAIGFISHFVLDAIPHWHYPLDAITIDANDPMKNNMRINKDFVFDMLKIGFDAALGIALSLLLFQSSHGYSLLAALMGASGGIAPDALQFVYWKWRHQPLIALQRFHIWIHAKTNLDAVPMLGISLQAFLALVIAVMWNSIS